MKKPLVLLILDGFGYCEARDHNAIAQADTPCWDALWAQYPHTLLQASGEAVGVPAGQMGNSEVGHLHMGAGRQIAQSQLRIDQAIARGEFAQNPVLNTALQQAQGQTLHIVGLLSPGGVHSHEDHVVALIALAKTRGVKHLFVHAILDGRDCPPQSAQMSLHKLEQALQGIGRIASICGRYYAMDRDQRWERTAQAYTLLTSGKGTYTDTNAQQALQAAYARGETDEFVKPTIISPAQPITEHAVVICMNFRADRMRQLTAALSSPDFTAFPRENWPCPHVYTLTEYADYLPVQVIFKTLPTTQVLGECIAAAGLRQLRIAETEKYAHVTFFINGGREQAFAQETRILVPSPKVATYDLQPEMSAKELTARLMNEIAHHSFDVAICNFANADMVGHTGNFAATVTAIETLDTCIADIVAALKTVDGELLITADHGNAEQMFDADSQQLHTAHTHNLVPVLYVGRAVTRVAATGQLYDIAPTMLHLLGLPIPPVMTGQILFTLAKK